MIFKHIRQASVDTLNDAGRQRTETAKDQLDRFMEVYHDLETFLTGPKIEDLLGRGNDFLKKPKKEQVTNLTNNLKILKAKWDNVTNGTNDKKIKLRHLAIVTQFPELWKPP